LPEKITREGCFWFLNIKIMTQQDALDILKLGHNIYLTGQPGSGKTFLLNKYISYLKENNRGVAITASTGIAATHMDGVTIHSWSGMGIKDKLTEQDIRKLLKKPYLRKRFKNTNVLIIDEVSMLHSFQFDIINRICQAFKASARAFGGMQIVCSGDFFQLPPVQKQGKPKFINESDIWQNLDIKICYLDEQHRQKDDGLTALLNCIRGNAIEKSLELLLNKKYQENSSAVSPIKLYTHNMDVDAINDFHLNKIEGKKFVYYMKTRGRENIAETLKKTCLAPEKLELKKGAKVMFIKNNFDRGYVNGTLGKVINFTEEKLPIVKTFRGKNIIVTPESWRIEEEDELKAEISQIPLRLAWAITVHKSQGMNLDAAEIDLSKCFLEGMGYVALSRLSALDGLKLMGINDEALLVNREIMKLDKILKQMSQEAVKYVKKIDIQEKRKSQKQFLHSLPQIEYLSVKKQKKEIISTFDKTKILIAAKLSIKEIAKRRGLTEETIISHLEKLKEKKEDVDLEYLRPLKNRFEKIKTAFQKSRDWLLSPAKEILGKDFSYKEIRIARLFLRK
jgi:hypothetical protein